MKESQLLGEYSSITKKSFTRQEILNIAESIIKGYNIVGIARKYKVNDKVIDKIFKEFLMHKANRDNILVTGCLGHKDVEYYEEEELLNLDLEYTWEKLSEVEKQFYLDYGKKDIQ
jgi:transposase-like protein